MAPRLAGQISIFGAVSLCPRLFWELRDKKKTLKMFNCDPEALKPCLNTDIQYMAYCGKHSHHNSAH